MDKAGAVRDMFDRIARRYDLANSVMTGGLDAAWRRRAVRELGTGPDASILDLCCGTGPLTLIAARSARRGRVVGVDFSAAMLEIARRRRRAPNIQYRQADVLALPFPDSEFDGATMGFSMRNVVDVAGCLREIARVLKVGARFVNLEVSRPRNALWGRLFASYFFGFVPAIGGLVGGDRAAYRYLPESLVNFPEPPALAELFAQNGFEHVRYLGLMGGIVTLHIGERRASAVNGVDQGLRHQTPIEQARPLQSA